MMPKVRKMIEVNTLLRNLDPDPLPDQDNLNLQEREDPEVLENLLNPEKTEEPLKTSLLFMLKD